MKNEEASQHAYTYTHARAHRERERERERDVDHISLSPKPLPHSRCAVLNVCSLPVSFRCQNVKHSHLHITAATVADRCQGSDRKGQDLVTVVARWFLIRPTNCSHVLYRSCSHVLYRSFGGELGGAILTPSLPWCRLKMTMKSAKFESLRRFLSSFSHWHVKGLSSKRTALKADVLQDRNIYTVFLQARPCIF